MGQFAEQRKWYYVPDKQLAGFNPFTFGEEYCKPLHRRGISVCDYWILHYVMSGRGVLLIGDDVYEVSASQCFIIRPYEHFFYQADEYDPWHYIWIAFSSDVDMSAFDSQSVISSASLREVFLKIMLAKDIRYGQQEYLSARIWDIVSCFYKSVKQPIVKTNEHIEQAKSYIEANYMQDISVSDIADMLCLERSYFSSLFKKYTGVSPQQYVIEYRLGKAAELLSEHAYNVGEAARAVGYTDVSNFSRMFKKLFGVSASKYAKDGANNKK